jgi:hypothetical protein
MKNLPIQQPILVLNLKSRRNLMKIPACHEVLSATILALLGQVTDALPLRLGQPTVNHPRKKNGGEMYASLQTSNRLSMSFTSPSLTRRPAKKS